MTCANANHRVTRGARAKNFVAALPMYDFPDIQSANDQLWHHLARQLERLGVPDVPSQLDRKAQLPSLWLDPNLLLAQTCGYPLVTDLRGQVQVVATPRYKAEGCRGPYHRACVVVRRSDHARSLSDLRGRRCAVNELSSNSGMNLLRATIAPLAAGTTFFSNVHVTGSHWQSLIAVVEERADVAAIDCVVLAHLRRFDPDLVDATRIIQWSDECPSLPLVTSRKTDQATLAALRQALQRVATDPDLSSVREQLLLDSFDVLSYETYEDHVLSIERRAAAMGYPSIT